MTLSADFFRDRYPGGLSDTVVFISACQTFGDQGTDLAGAIKGPSSIFLGWSDVVFSGESKQASLQFYRDAAEYGYPATEAYTRLGDLRVGTAAEGYGVPQLVLGDRSTGDLHIREVVRLLDPESGNVLSSSSSVRIKGEAGDDEDDIAPYRVRIDGIVEEFASEAILHVSIDGNEADPQPISEGTKQANDRWIVSGEIDLGYDLEENSQVEIRAWVELPSGGESDHEVRATLSGFAPPMGFTWQLDLEWSRLPVGEPGDPASPQSASARLFLEYDASWWDRDENPRYEVTGGTVTYSHSFVDRFCEVSADVITFELSKGMAGFSRLDFDITSTPFQFESFINTSGPTFEAQYACRAGTGRDAPEGYGEPEPRTRSADVLWLSIDEDDNRTVAPGATSFSGQIVVENRARPGSIRTTDYTFTRIK